MTSFKTFHYPDVIEKTLMPEDVELRLPQKTDLPKDQWHFLVYIPWDEKYLKLIPQKYRDFFDHCLPYLQARTTDVHTAICLSFLQDFLSKFTEENIKERVIALALILHDCGWSKLTDEEIAASLGVSGLKLTKSATAPKEKHAVEGKEVASKILKEYQFSPQLKKSELEFILDCILFHDKPEKLKSNYSKIPLEMKILADLDHLWSFTHENFWQDTVRKNISTNDYLKNLDNDLDLYFTTQQGKEFARKLLAERTKEVQVFNEQKAN